jgi:hypothetical protein
MSCLVVYDQHGNIVYFHKGMMPRFKFNQPKDTSWKLDKHKPDLDKILVIREKKKVCKQK